MSDDSHTFSEGLNNVACVSENHKWLLYWCYHAFLSWSLLQASKLSSLMEQQVSKFDCGPIPDFTSLSEVLLLGRTPSSFPNNLDVEYNLDQARCWEHSLGQNENPCQVWCLCVKFVLWFSSSVDGSSREGEWYGFVNEWFFLNLESKKRCQNYFWRIMWHWRLE